MWFFAVLLFLHILPCLANFGLASLDTLLTFSDPTQDNSVLREKIIFFDDVRGGGGAHKKSSSADLCRRFGLYGWQRSVCQKNPEMTEVLTEAVRLSVSECQDQFRYERWNCSLDTYRKQILKNDFRETGFLHAISAAGLVHSISRACSRGRLDLCTCDDRSYHQQANKNAWKWGGCGDNLNFGRKFARQILRRNLSSTSGGARNSKTIQHNLEVGVKAVKKGFRSVCKCHGVSGSCSTRTCWRQLAPFQETGSLLKTKYDQAAMVTANRANENRNVASSSKLGDAAAKPPASPAAKKNQLIYTQESPNFCTAGKFSPGTSARRCEKNSSCEVLCCGRGYNVGVVTVRQRCNCEVIWCCDVRCDICTNQREIYTCK